MKKGGADGQRDAGEAAWMESVEGELVKAAVNRPMIYFSFSVCHIHFMTLT